MKIGTVLVTAASLFVALTALAAPSNRSLPLGAPLDGSPYPFPMGTDQVFVQRHVLIPMRDGVRLAADLYWPGQSTDAAARQGPLAAILVRTPYDKRDEALADTAKHFASHGYVVVLQDQRGRYESEGLYTFSVGARNDGYDTLEWLSHQPWSNGRIGTYGCSDLGENQYMLAATRHPAHRAAIVQSGGGGIGSAGNLYSALGDNHSARGLALSAEWFREAGFKYSPHLPANMSEADFLAASAYVNYEPVLPKVEDWNAVWRSLPVVDILKTIGAPPTDFEEFLLADADSIVFKSRGYLSDEDRFATPVLHINSWFDFGVSSSLYAFKLFSAHADTEEARSGQYAVISPTGHCHSEKIAANGLVGEREFGDARFNYFDLYLQWYKHWLYDGAAEVLQRPKVQFYVMGRNAWAQATDWPPPGRRTESYYLSSAGHANTASGDGRLVKATPSSGQDSFRYDPNDPVPSLGGPYCCWSGSSSKGAGSYDQKETEARQDVLVYTSERLASPLLIAGRPEVELFVSSTAPDTDFVARLEDVDELGHAYNVTEQIIRARHRNGLGKPSELMVPKHVYRVLIPLPDVAYEFLRGHRLRLAVTSSNFPAFTRNLNTGDDSLTTVKSAVAVNSVWHALQGRSQIRLPIIPANLMSQSGVLSFSVQ